MELAGSSPAARFLPSGPMSGDDASAGRHAQGVAAAAPEPAKAVGLAEEAARPLTCAAGDPRCRAGH